MPKHDDSKLLYDFLYKRNSTTMDEIFSFEEDKPEVKDMDKQENIREEQQEQRKVNNEESKEVPKSKPSTRVQ